MRPDAKGSKFPDASVAVWRMQAESFFKTEQNEADAARPEGLVNAKFHRMATYDLIVGTDWLFMVSVVTPASVWDKIKSDTGNLASGS